jgi:molecular chaperone GrpE
MSKAKKDEAPEEKPLEAEIVQDPASGEVSPEVNPAEELETALKAEKDKYLRLAAEYDNYRKRSMKEREALFDEVRSDTIAKLLPVYDNLLRALKQECTDEAFYKGVELTMAQLKEILQKCGVTEIPSVGETFNPDLHNAVMHVEDPSLGASTVAEEFEKGFMLGDKVIRCSMVKVAN